MTTNQTIDGVPLLPCPFCGGEPYGTHDHYVHDDLSPMPCVECRACSAHLKAEDWNRRAEPAAQPQGEPVAWMQPGQGGMCISNEVKLHSLKMAGAPASAVSCYSVPLYAGQPAPVAAAPEGWQMVPVAPTDDMIVAFAEAWYSKHQTIDDPSMLEAYHDMLVVAPTYPRQQ